MEWITANIAIGNFIDAKSASDEVDAILCLISDCCDEKSVEVDVLAIPMVDGVGNDKRRFNDAVDFIDAVVNSGEKILVHCHAGRSRSVCIVARFFMSKCGLTSHQALEKIKSKKEIYLSPGIEEILVL